jgi:hypothetical protein
MGTCDPATSVAFGEPFRIRSFDDDNRQRDPAGQNPQCWYAVFFSALIKHLERRTAHQYLERILARRHAANPQRVLTCPICEYENAPPAHLECKVKARTGWSPALLDAEASLQPRLSWAAPGTTPFRTVAPSLLPYYRGIARPGLASPGSREKNAQVDHFDGQ